MSYRTEGENFHPSVGGRGSLRGDGAWGVAGGPEQGAGGMGRVSKGLEGWGLEGPGVWVGGLEPGGTDVRSFARSYARTGGNYPPLFYRTSSPSGPLPKKLRLGSRPRGNRSPDLMRFLSV